MRRALVAGAPAAAFALVLLNALFGHALAGTGGAEDRYSTYVRLLPGWESAPKSIVFEVNAEWLPPGGPGAAAGPAADPAPGPGAGEGSNRLASAGGRPLVELRHGHGGCAGSEPVILYRRAADAAAALAGWLLGERPSPDPADPAYSARPGPPRGPVGPSGYALLLPLCASSEVAAYDYGLRVGGGAPGADAWFVGPGYSAADFYAGGPPAGPAPGCAVYNAAAAGGTCAGVPRGGGLLVAVPDALEAPVTKVTVNLRERPYP